MQKPFFSKAARINFLKAFLVAGAFLLHALPSRAAWHVATNGADVGNDGLSWNAPFLTIGKALASASAVTADSILVSNGAYAISSLISVTKPVTITGVNGWSNTAVIGNATVGCITLNNPSAVLRGFTITNGLANYGGGVNLLNGAVHDCLITGNKCVYNGGGVRLDTAPTYSLVSNCIIRGNQSPRDGGGVYMNAGKLVDCIIDYNVSLSASYYGGGVNVAGGEYISGCTIKSNTAYGSGGGIYVNSANFALTNCNVDNNYANTYGGGIYSTAKLTINGGSVNSNTIGSYYGAGINTSGGLIASNVSISYNYLTNAWGGAGLDVSAAEVVFDNCDISYNRTACLPADRSGQYGGGMYFRGSNLTVRNSRFIGNTIVNIKAVTGGAIHSLNNKGSVLIENCVIKSNAITAGTAIGSGGGLYLSSNAVVRNCEISGNCASLRTDTTGTGNGGGIYIASANRDNVIESCTIAGNYARSSGPGLYLIGNGQDLVRNCVVQSNHNATASTNWYFGNAARRSYVSFTCTPEIMAGEGNTTADPRFLDFGAGNYRPEAGSPCVNNGQNHGWMAGAADLDGYSRLDKYSGRVDMGCYESRLQGMLFICR